MNKMAEYYKQALSLSDLFGAKNSAKALLEKIKPTQSAKELVSQNPGKPLEADWRNADGYSSTRVRQENSYRKLHNQ